MSKQKFFVTVGKNPFGAASHADAAGAISLAEQAKAEFPNADVVAWCQPVGLEPFEIWENGNPEHAQ